MSDQRHEIEDAEHESGLRPFGEYPSHCLRCVHEAARRERAATCAHEDATDIVALGHGVIARLCDDCGSRLPIT